jgi:predicted dehydrogenase
MRLMTGQEPVAGKALAHVGASGVDEWLSAVLEFPNGAIGHFDCGVRAQRTHTYEIRGTKGRILVEQAFVPEPHEQPLVRWWHDDQYEVITMPAANQYTLMIEDFADSLLNNRPPRYAGQDGVANMQVIDRLLADARR